MSFKKQKKRSLSTIQLLPIWKGKITAIGNGCCFYFIFVDNQPNVNEMSGYFQYSYGAAWQQLSDAATAKVLISVPQNESSRLFLSCHFAPMLKKKGEIRSWTGVCCERGVFSLSQLFLLLSPHRKSQTEVDEAGWGKVSKPEKAKKITVAWQRQPTIFTLLIVV